jgi:hypothetical protein
MPNQHRVVDLKRLHHRKDVIAKVVRRIVAVGWCRTAGCARSSSRDPVNVVLLSELRREAVEAMRRVSSPSQENERPAGPTPVQHFKLNTWFYGDHLDSMWRRIRLGHCMRKKPGKNGEQERQLPQLSHVPP